MSRIARSAAALTSLTAAILMLSACGDDSSDDGVSSLSTTDSSAQEDSDTPVQDSGSGSEDEELELAQQYAECMRDNGVDYPDPEVDAQGNVMMQGPPMGDPTVDKALEKCEEYLPSSMTSEVDEKELQDSLLAYAQCMRDNGYDMPDPDFSGDAIEIPNQKEDDPAWAQADEKCNKELTELGGGR